MILSRISRKTSSVVRLCEFIHPLANGRSGTWKTDVFAAERTHGNDAIQYPMSFSAELQVIKPECYKGHGKQFWVFYFVYSVRSEVFSLVLAWAFMCFLE